MNLLKTLLILFLCFCETSVAEDFFVSPNGDDQASGLSSTARSSDKDGPFRTLERAQSAVRALKSGGKLKQALTVHVAAGNYQLQKPLEFNIRDSGFADRKIIWQAEPGATISGGIALNGCAADQNGLWHCPVAGLNLDSIKYPNTTPKKGLIPGFNLFVNQHRLHLARWPDHDWAHIKTPLDEKTHFSVFEQLPAVNSAEAQVHIFPGNDWYDEYLPVSAVDTEHNAIKLSAATVYPLDSGRRFYLQNILSELDTPGEWFYDKANAQILFIPPAQEKPETITLSSLPNLIKIDGASYIGFHHFSFRHSTGAAISINKAQHINMDDIEVNQVDTSAIEAVESSNIYLTDSRIYDTGGGGIVIAGGNRKTLEAANNLVQNNHFHDFGKIIYSFSPAIDTQGVGSRITHNLIENAAGPGVSISGNDHLFEKNEIRHICEQASDCGAVYSGRNWTWRGNIIRYNSIHDIFGYGLQTVDIANNIVKYSSPSADGARGIFLDDGISGFTVFGNILNNAGATPLMLAGGRDTLIENNIIKADIQDLHKFGIWVDYRSPNYDWSSNRNSLKEVPYQSPIWQKKYPALSLPMGNDTWPEGNIIKHNIIISNRSTGESSQRYNMPAKSNYVGNNLVWNTKDVFRIDYDILDRHIKKDAALWTEWLAEGVETDSLNADPCATITGNRVTFCKNTVATKIGFKPIPDDIGYNGRH